MRIRATEPRDADAVWAILEPIVRAGETYALPRDMAREDALAFWHAPSHEAFVAEDPEGRVVGTYFLQPNQLGPGSHVSNCGYATATWATGRGIARAMCAHSLDRARERGFRSMQYNIVVSTNVRAVRLWIEMGFQTLCRVPGAFQHPTEGEVDTLVMFRKL